MFRFKYILPSKFIYHILFLILYNTGKNFQNEFLIHNNREYLNLLMINIE